MREKRLRMRDDRSSRWGRKHDKAAWVSSENVDNKWVQDRSEKMVIIGSDCAHACLYTQI